MGHNDKTELDVRRVQIPAKPAAPPKDPPPAPAPAEKTLDGLAPVPRKQGA